MFLDGDGDDDNDNDTGNGPEWVVDREREREMSDPSVPRDTPVICLICGQTFHSTWMVMTMTKK